MNGVVVAPFGLKLNNCILTQRSKLVANAFPSTDLYAPGGGCTVRVKFGSGLGLAPDTTMHWLPELFLIAAYAWLGVGVGLRDRGRGRA